MRLQRHEEAENVLSRGPQFAVEAATEFFGAASNACLLLISAQVHMASGRLGPQNMECLLFVIDFRPSQLLLKLIILQEKMIYAELGMLTRRLEKSLSL